MTQTKRYAIRCYTEEQARELMKIYKEKGFVFPGKKHRTKELLFEIDNTGFHVVRPTTIGTNYVVITYEEAISKGLLGTCKETLPVEPQHSEVFDKNEKVQLSKEQFELIVNRVDKFNEIRGYTEMDYGDVIYTYFYPNRILNDWDEGQDNDPYRDKETNTHSCIKFINDLVKEVLSYKK